MLLSEAIEKLRYIQKSYADMPVHFVYDGGMDVPVEIIRVAEEEDQRYAACPDILPKRVVISNTMHDYDS